MSKKWTLGAYGLSSKDKFQRSEKRKILERNHIYIIYKKFPWQCRLSQVEHFLIKWFPKIFLRQNAAIRRHCIRLRLSPRLPDLTVENTEIHLVNHPSQILSGRTWALSWVWALQSRALGLLLEPPARRGKLRTEEIVWSL